MPAPPEVISSMRGWLNVPADDTGPDIDEAINEEWDDAQREERSFNARRLRRLVPRTRMFMLKE